MVVFQYSNRVMNEGWLEKLGPRYEFGNSASKTFGISRWRKLIGQIDARVHINQFRSLYENIIE